MHGVGGKGRGGHGAQDAGSNQPVGERPGNDPRRFQLGGGFALLTAVFASRDELHVAAVAIQYAAWKVVTGCVVGRACHGRFEAMRA